MARGPNNDDVIDFTPEPGFTIENLARTIVEMMRELEMDARVTLPDNVVVEIDKECTVREIIQGYQEFISDRVKSRTPSNKNEKQPKKK